MITVRRSGLIWQAVAQAANGWHGRGLCCIIVDGNLLEAFIAKRDEYPETMSDAIALLNKYNERKQPPTVASKGTAFAQKGKKSGKKDKDKEKDESKSKDRESEKKKTSENVECFKCDKKGHMANKCPKKKLLNYTDDSSVSTKSSKSKLDELEKIVKKIKGAAGDSDDNDDDSDKDHSHLQFFSLANYVHFNSHHPQLVTQASDILCCLLHCNKLTPKCARLTGILSLGTPIDGCTI